MSSPKAFDFKFPLPPVKDYTKAPYTVCPKCGFYVNPPFHKPSHCQTRRRLARLCDGMRTLAAIGAELGITRERVRQLYLSHPDVVALRRKYPGLRFRSWGERHLS